MFRNIKKTYEQWLSIWSMLYLISMFLIFPLYYRDNYIDILEAKTVFFRTATVIYIGVGILILYFVSVYRAEDRKKTKIKRRKEERKPWIWQDRCLVVFVGAVLISTLLSGDIKNAWYSSDGKLFGTMIILLCCLLYWFIARGVLVNKWVKMSLTAGCLLVFGLAILNRYKIDPLFMYSNLIEYQQKIYISTIGNVNIVSNYISIFLPLLAGCFLYTKEIVWKIVYGAVFCVGVMAGIGTNSDSFFLGFGAMMLFYLWFSMESRDKFSAYVILCVVCASSLACLKWFNKLSSYSDIWEKLQKKLINQPPWFYIAVSLLIVAILINRFGAKWDYLKTRKILFAGLAFCVVIFVVYVVRLNMSAEASENSYLIFNDEWGTNRGFVWSRTCVLWKELPLYQKLFGIGPGGFKDFFEIYNEERTSMSLLPFVDPHSEVLYYWVMTGICGFLGFFGMIFSAVLNCFKIKSEKTIILAAIVLSWFMQGTVNNPIVFTTPYLFVFLGMISDETRKKSNSVDRAIFEL